MSPTRLLNSLFVENYPSMSAERNGGGESVLGKRSASEVEGGLSEQETRPVPGWEEQGPSPATTIDQLREEQNAGKSDNCIKYVPPENYDWDPSGVMLFYGKQEIAGKSVVASRITRLIYEQHPDIKDVMLFCPGGKMKKAWQWIAKAPGLGPSRVVEKEFWAGLKKVIDKQKEEFESKGRCRKLMVICDDLMGHSKTRDAEGMELVSLLGSQARQVDVNIFLVFICQDVAFTPPGLRSNAHYVCVGAIAPQQYDLLSTVQTKYLRGDFMANCRWYLEPGTFQFLVFNCFANDCFLTFVPSAKKKYPKVGGQEIVCTPAYRTPKTPGNPLE